MSPSERLQRTVEALHYLAPWVQFIYFFVTIVVSLCAIPKLEVKPKKTAPRKAILSTTALVLLTYVCKFNHSESWLAVNHLQAGEAALIIAQFFTRNGPMATKDHNIYALSSTIVWFAVLAVLLSSEDPNWWPFYSFWLCALATEITLSGLSMSSFRPLSPLEYAQFGFQISRLGLLITLLVLYFVVGRSKSRSSRSDEEAAPLLAHAQENSDGSQKPGNDSSYGSTSTDNANKSAPANVTNEDHDNDGETKETKKEKERIKRMHDRMREKGNWLTYAREFLVGAFRFSSSLSEIGRKL